MGWMYIAGGVLLIIFGAIVFFEGGFTRYGVFGAVSKPVSIGIIVYGLFMMRAGYKVVTTESTSKKTANYLKCISCGNVFRFFETSNWKCPDCSGKLEDLEGFFERHPKFKNR
jgi:membrane-bound ClpP family serine protease